MIILAVTDLISFSFILPIDLLIIDFSIVKMNPESMKLIFFSFPVSKSRFVNFDSHGVLKLLPVILATITSLLEILY